MPKVFNTIYVLLGLCIIFTSFAPDLRVEASDAYNEDPESENKPLVEVRAVFINCRMNEGQASPDTEAARFQREELFKHSALKDCNTKLALILKLASSPEGSSDEYIPIDHVIEGPRKKRVRLLNPYVLRLRWENPMQAYKLQNMDTVTGVIADTGKRSVEKIHTKHKKDRVQRSTNQLMQDLSDSLGPSSFFTADHDTYIDSQQIVSTSPPEADRKIGMKRSAELEKYFNTSLLRKKRQLHNIVVEPQISDEASWISNFDATDVYEESRKTGDAEGASVPHKHETRENNFWKKTKSHFDKYFPQSGKLSHKHHFYPKKMPSENSVIDGDVYRENEPYKDSDSDSHNLRGFPTSSERSKSADNDIYAPENKYFLFDIGNPDIWCVVHVQLFEKLNTPEGKTVWNDITKGETASVSSLTPEWRDQDLNIRYRSTEWTSQGLYTLPVATNLCLLVPQNSDSDDSEFIIVPTEDVVMINNDDIILNKRDENNSNDAVTEASMAKRKVMVRITRNLQHGIDNLKIVKQGSDQYLTLPHRRPHHIQIDVETRADDNQLIRVGADGRITTAVSDNSRRTRTVFTVQATNTGLAAAKFKIKMRDCGPELSSLIQDRSRAGADTDFVLIPPRHTRRINLELPVELPGQVAHCSVALINQDDEAVAIRDVTIKSGDRCFCVWHCDCVCLSEDPKLLCREMSESRQAAAGLTRERSRHARNAFNIKCYPDRKSINVLVVVGGVLGSLFFLGFLKACLGLVIPSISSLYLNKIVKLPRKMEHYYESSLADKPVVFDSDGWPLHPETNKRSVRAFSWGIQFMLNIIFFIAAPCMICWSAVKNLISERKPKKHTNEKNKSSVSRSGLSANFQEELPRLRLRRTRRLRNWMTPEADDLSTKLWRQGLLPERSINCNFMQPLLAEDDHLADDTQSSSVDSEGDDTEYVLTQMQKSRESLARTQMMKINTSPSTK